MAETERFLSQNKRLFIDVRGDIVTQCQVAHFKVNKIPTFSVDEKIAFAEMIVQSDGVDFPIRITVSEPRKRDVIVEVTIDYNDKEGKSKAPRSFVQRTFGVGAENADVIELPVNLTSDDNEHAVAMIKRAIVISIRELLQNTYERMKNKVAA